MQLRKLLNQFLLLLVRIGNLLIHILLGLPQLFQHPLALFLELGQFRLLLFQGFLQLIGFLAVRFQLILPLCHGVHLLPDLVHELGIVAGNGRENLGLLGQIRQALGIEDNFQGAGLSQLIQSADTFLEGFKVRVQLRLGACQILLQGGNFPVQLIQPLIGIVNLIHDYLALFFQGIIVFLLLGLIVF